MVDQPPRVSHAHARSCDARMHGSGHLHSKHRQVTSPRSSSPRSRSARRHA